MKLFSIFFILVFIILINKNILIQSNDILNQNIDAIIERDYSNFIKEYNKISNKLSKAENSEPNINSLSHLDKEGNLPGYKCQHEELMKNRKLISHSNNSSNLLTNMKLQLNNQQSQSNESGKIRFYFDTTYLFNQVDKHACQSVGQKIVVGGVTAGEVCSSSSTQPCLFTCDEKSVLNSKLAALINGTMLNTIASILGSFVNIKNPVDHLKLVPTYGDGECDYDYKIPTKYYNTGVFDADMVIFVTSRPTIDSTTIAYAMICSFNVNNQGKFGRPLGATINFNPQYFQDFINSPTGSLYKQYIRVGLHEMIHALGFSSNFYSSFTGPDGNYYNPTPGSSIIISGTTPSGVDYQYERKVIKTPTVTDFVQKHYDCDHINYMELEDLGSSGTAGAHWEKRTAGEDLMIGFIQPVFLITNLTLSLLEDTGFYNIDFSKAEMLNWGKNLGCNWLKTCDKNTWDFPGYFCDQTEYTCTPTRTGKGICGVATYQNIPLNYQHFTQKNLGGLDEVADLCPYSMVLSQQSQSYYCIQPENQNLGDSSVFEKFGENSRCFEYETLLGGSGLGCYQQRCQGEKLQIEIDEEWFDCPEGSSISNNGITVSCPIAYYPCLPVGVSPPIRSSSTQNHYNSFLLILLLIIIMLLF